MENYLMLNGKRIDLTEEQIRTLGLKTEKEDYFSRYGDYYYIGVTGDVFKDYEDENSSCNISKRRYNAGNYCKNEELLKQRALHEVLNRLLWRFSMENDADKIDWNRAENRYVICKRGDEAPRVVTIVSDTEKYMMNYFYSYSVATRALNEIVLPFMEKHPEFVW